MLPLPHTFQRGGEKSGFHLKHNGFSVLNTKEEITANAKKEDAALCLKNVCKIKLFP